jgi:uncharacterized protein YfaQ (DUF2300 family)
VRMYKVRLYRISRTRRLAALWWVFACILLAIQGIAAADPQCSPAEAAASVESAMPEMTDHSAMWLATQPDAHTSGSCQHCHPHTHGHGCQGVHSCSPQLAPAITPSVTLHVMQLQLALLPAA